MTVKPKGCIVDVLLLAGLPVLLSVAGLAIAYFTFLYSDIPWRRFGLPTPPRPPVAIQHVDLNSAGGDPTGDIVYIKMENGAVYAEKVPTGPWRWVDPAFTWDADYTSDCAPDWPSEQSGSHIWDPPPVEKVVDSAGVRFEHPPAMDVRCYVILGDGSVEVWARGDNGRQGMVAFILCAPVFASWGA